MLDQLFTQNPQPPMQVDPLRPLKGVMVGTGQVGMACAYAMVIQNTFDELVLVDLNRDKLEGEVMDLQQGMSFVQPTTVTAGTLADGSGADIVIITAGAARSRGRPV
jgi:L-lactate dehydrogenase